MTGPSRTPACASRADRPSDGILGGKGLVRRRDLRVRVVRSASDRPRRPSAPPDPAIAAEARRRFSICRVCEHSRDDGFACELHRGCCFGRWRAAPESHCPVRRWQQPYRLRAIGHLFEAEDESQEWPELHAAIRKARKAYQADGTMPDFEDLGTLANGVRAAL